MIDDEGKLKPFAKWVKDAQPYLKHKNKHWLQTEYDTAVGRAHMAAQWKGFEDTADVLPNLEWIQSTSITPGADHRIFWGTILPINHKFWTKHRPKDRWNCKCGLEATDEPPTDAPDVLDDKDNEPSPGLENNPADDAKIFSDKHPYYPDSCLSCPFASTVAKLVALAGGRRALNCSKCKDMAKIINRDDSKQRKWIRNIFKDIESGRLSKRSIIAGSLDSAIVRYAAKIGLELQDHNIVLLDKQLAHAIRLDKIKRGQAVSRQQLINFSTNIKKADIYYDTDKQNFVYVCEENGDMWKYIVQPNYRTKTNGKKLTSNFFITAGKIRCINTKDWIKIK